jgi:hypothetical protein
MKADAKKELLSNHLPYELLMLRYTYREINATQPALRWNALFESFATHARGLHEFLTGKSDNRNGHATDFVEAFKSRKPDKVRGKIDALNQKMMHLGTTRTARQEEKIDLGDAKVLFDWIEGEVLRFVGSLPENLKKHWKPERADTANADATFVIAPVQASATNHIEIMSS